MKIKLLSFCVVVSFTRLVFADQSVELKIEGVKDAALMNNINIYLSQLANEEADGSERYQHLVQETVDKALRAKGYFNSQYQFHQTQRKKKSDLLVLNIQLDKPVKIDEIDFNLQGDAQNDPDFNRLRQQVPKQGTILNQESYDNFKSDIEKLSQNKGYFDSHWQYHRLEIYPDEHNADWRLGYDSGVRYHYGKISFRDSQIREDYLENILRIKAGDPYVTQDLSQLTSDFLSSKWFNSVLIEPKIRESTKTVDLKVLLIPRKKNSMEVGIGFATDVGARLQLNWKKPWINNRGHSLESTTYISRPEQRFEFGYNMPVRTNPLNFYYQISGGIEREVQNDTRTTGANLGFQRFWNHETGWAFSLGVKARYDSFEQGSQKFKTLLLYPTASMNRTRSDGKRFPVWGDSQKITLNWGSRAWGSDVNFYSIKASTAWIRTYAQNHRIYLRGEVAYLHADTFERMPPSLRYFAGGDRSIRGFGYKAISPRDPKNGKLTGATHLATATFEYQYQVIANWWGAAFYDTGLASRYFNRQQLHSGAGIGVRWASPIGAIKLDLAMPVKSPNNQKGIQFYLGLGSEL